MRSAIVTLLSAACLALAACGDDSGGEPTEPGGVAGPTGVQGDPAPEPGADPPKEGRRGSAEGGGGDPERAIRAAIEDAIASGDTDRACGSAVTQDYLRDAYGDAAGCRGAQSAAFAAEIIEIGDISIEPGRARTTVRARGGPYGGERLEVELVREGGTWKVDRLRSNIPPGP